MNAKSGLKATAALGGFALGSYLIYRSVVAASSKNNGHTLQDALGRVERDVRSVERHVHRLSSAVERLINDSDGSAREPSWSMVSDDITRDLPHIPRS